MSMSRLLSGGLTPPPGLVDEGGCQDASIAVFCVIVVLFVVLFAWLFLSRNKNDEKTEEEKENKPSQELKEAPPPTPCQKNEENLEEVTLDDKALSPEEQELLRDYRKGKANAAPNQTAPTPTQNDDSTPSSQGHPWLTTFLILLLVVVLAAVGIGYCARKDNKESTARPTITERVATSNDIQVTTAYSFPISVAVKVVVYEDIKGLVLKISYLDEQNNVVKTQYEAFGNVYKNNAYERTISITDFSWNELTQIVNCRVSVYDGTVSLL